MDVIEGVVHQQAGAGSFNDLAIHKLQEQRAELATLEVDPRSCTPMMAMERAASQENGFAFVALRNDIIDLVNPTIAALQRFEILNLVDAIRMQIEMCLVLKEGATIDGIDTVASILPALGQVKGWIESHGITNIKEVPAGTAAAANMLSTGELGPNVGVIAPERVVDVYPGLQLAEKGIQDRQEGGRNNYTTFGLLKVREREVPISNEEARQILINLIDQIRGRIVEDESFCQVMDKTS